MVNVKEIRIGNLFVGYDDKIFDWKIEDFILLKNGIELDEIIKSNVNLEEEILLKCGFELIGKIHPLYRLGNFKFLMLEQSLLKKDYTVRYYLNKNESVAIGKCSHLHQLQNLYHALTGQELTISL